MRAHCADPGIPPRSGELAMSRSTFMNRVSMSMQRHRRHAGIDISQITLTYSSVGDAGGSTSSRIEFGNYSNPAGSLTENATVLCGGSSGDGLNSYTDRPGTVEF